MERKEPDIILDKDCVIEKFSLMFALPLPIGKCYCYIGWRSKIANELKIISVGEHWKKTLADRFCRICKDLELMYVPTETTVYSTIRAGFCRQTKIVTVGKTPVANTRIHILAC